MTNHVFVYGTLRRGGRNHHLLSHSGYEGVFFHSGFEMWSFGAYPGIIPSSDSSTIKTECYEVNPVTLQLLDRLEQFRGEDHPQNVYDRILVEADNGKKGWIYVFRKELMDHPGFSKNLAKVPDGDWIRYLAEITGQGRM